MLLIVSFSTIESFLNEVLVEKFHISRQTVRGELREQETGGTFYASIRMSAIVGSQLFQAEELWSSNLPRGGALYGFVERFDVFVQRLQEAGLQFRAGNFAPFVKGVEV